MIKQWQDIYIYYQWIWQSTTDYLIEKDILDCIVDKNVLIFQINVFIHAKLIDRGLKKCMFCDAIISIDKAITGNMYYKRNFLVIWDYLIEKTILDYSDEKNVINILIYVSMLSS